MTNEYLKGRKIAEEVSKVVIGKKETISKVLAAILAGGHILLEDIPGVGKTTMAMAFSKSMSLKQNRVQFTPDVLPSDITGFSIYNHKTGTFEYKKGAIMCNLFLGDEINRTSPKTQSALLEVMEEGSVTVDGETMPVPKPFIVIATQNPSGSSGTQKLPDSQLDRFMIKLSIGYPDSKSMINILKGKQNSEPIDSLLQVVTKEEILFMQSEVENISVGENIYDYIVRLTEATRINPYIELGLSPRGSIAILKMAKALAYLNGRDYMLPEDIQYIFKDVSAHRIILNSKAKINGITEYIVLDNILNEVRPSQVSILSTKAKKS